MTKSIPLTMGYEAIVDDEDYERVSRLKWHAKVEKRWSGLAVYAAHTEPGTFRTIRLHRFVLGEPEGWMVDHRDGDGLNCTRANLRLATRSQNQHNRRPQINSAASCKGAYRSGNRWRSEIRVSGKRIHLGSFATPEEAGDAYQKAAKQYHGDFVWTPPAERVWPPKSGASNG